MILDDGGHGDLRTRSRPVPDEIEVIPGVDEAPGDPVADEIAGDEASDAPRSERPRGRVRHPRPSAWRPRGATCCHRAIAGGAGSRRAPAAGSATPSRSRGVSPGTTRTTRPTRTPRQRRGTNAPGATVSGTSSTPRRPDLSGFDLERLPKPRASPSMARPVAGSGPGRQPPTRAPTRAAARIPGPSRDSSRDPNRVSEPNRTRRSRARRSRTGRPRRRDARRNRAHGPPRASARAPPLTTAPVGLAACVHRAGRRRGRCPDRGRHARAEAATRSGPGDDATAGVGGRGTEAVRPRSVPTRPRFSR